MYSKIVLLFIVLIIGKGAICQSQNYFHIDENKILQNKSLDFFVNKLKSEHFTIHKSKEEIPSFIKEQLPFLSDRGIADPGEKFQVTDEVTDTLLPDRQLIFLCNSDDIYVVTYEKGGIGTNYNASSTINNR